MNQKISVKLIGTIIGLIIGIILFFVNCWGLFNCAEGASCGNPMYCIQIHLFIIIGLIILGYIIGWIFIKIKS